MSKILFNQEMFIEDIVLKRFQKMVGEYGWKRMFDKMITKYGIIKSEKTKDIFTELQVYESSAGKIGVRAGSAFTSNLDFIFISSDKPDLLTIPNDNVVRKVFIQYANTNIEQGVIQLNADGSIVGTGTKFLESFNVGFSIEIVGSVSGNDGTYQITSITDNLNLDTNATFVVEAGLSFKVISIHTPGYTVPLGDEYIYSNDTFNITLEDSSNIQTDTKFLLGQVNYDGTTLEIADNRIFNILKMWNDNVWELKNGYTTSNVFRVGGATGQPVLLEPLIPSVMSNFKIEDVTSVGNLVDLDSTTFASQVAQANVKPDTNKLRYYFSWGYNNVEGVGGINTFQISAGATIVNGQLDNYYLFIPTKNESYLITDSTAAGLLTIQKVGGGTIDLTGENPTSLNPAIIHHNAESYSLIAIPLIPGIGTIVERRRVENNILYKKDKNAPVLQEGFLDLDIGTTYHVYVKTINGTFQTDLFELPAGSYSKYGVVQNYVKPLIISHPIIDATGAGVGALTTRNGFDVSISNWNSAEQFEMVWTDKVGGADFNNSSHQHRIVPSNLRNISIPTNVAQQYDIKVRPLISSFQVSPALGTNVVSGASGLKPGDIVLLNFAFNKSTYNGTINSIINTVIFGTVTMWEVDVSTFFFPANAINQFSYGAIVPDNLLGSIITSNGKDYLFLSKIADNKMALAPIGHSTPPTVGAFTVNTSKRGRQIYVANNITLDYRIVRVDVDVDGFIGDAGETGLFRLFQKTRESFYDSVILNALDTGFTQDVDLLLLASYGNRDLVADLYDDNTPANNELTITGRCTIYARPYQIEQEDVVNVTV